VAEAISVAALVDATTGAGLEKPSSRQHARLAGYKHVWWFALDCLRCSGTDDRVPPGWRPAGVGSAPPALAYGLADRKKAFSLPLVALAARKILSKGADGKAGVVRPFSVAIRIPIWTSAQADR
jgi:hypothetical protein